MYDEPTGFEAFIDNASNPALYVATIAHLATLHRARQPGRVLDVGCGDGRVTASVLSGSANTVELVEPSAALLALATAAVEATGATVVGHGCGLQDLLAEGGTSTWDLVQATFALHTLAPAARGAMLAGLAERCAHLVLVEFDVPDLPDRDTRLGYLAERYARAVAEYVCHPEAISGFLLPVLVGQLDPTRPRHTYEQPAAAWVDELRRAGFTEVTVHPLHDYWWAPAVVVQATGRAPRR